MMIKFDFKDYAVLMEVNDIPVSTELA